MRMEIYVSHRLKNATFNEGTSPTIIERTLVTPVEKLLELQLRLLAVVAPHMASRVWIS
jgi:hypothetical protein